MGEPTITTPRGTNETKPTRFVHTIRHCSVTLCHSITVCTARDTIIPSALHEMKGAASGPREWVCVHKSTGSCCYSLSDPRSVPPGRGHRHRLSERPPPTPLPQGPISTCQVCTQRRGALSAPRPSSTFLHGLDDTSNEALNALLCWVVRMVLGRLGRLWSLPSSAAPLPAPWADLQRLSSSSLLPGEAGDKL